ncbi:hypothetical protein [Prochlorococcus marinus]|uniref:hypothetical protein n=1 Tax=Prochlorococcus marinus TaxID=1219 RepID=UPI001F2E4CDA|nr:hypothetical protein [Prochlorococcus marinus]
MICHWLITITPFGLVAFLLPGFRLKNGLLSDSFLWGPYSLSSVVFFWWLP